MVLSFIHLTVLALSATTTLAAPKLQNTTAATIVWDGRIPSGSTAALFDSSKSPFGTSSVFGQNLTFSKLIKMPNTTTASLFDSASNSMPLEVTISDASIFVPGGTPQLGFRRAELNPNLNSSIGSPAVSGVKTLHFSVQLDPARPLNYSHEYQIVFLETADFSNTQFTLKTGTILGGNATADPKTLNLSGYGAKETLYQTPFVAGWHNFGLVLDFDKNTTEVLYSQGSQPLSKVTSAISNDMAGGGSYHFGVLKKPTGNTADVVHQGYQESGINEGLIYGGLWMEDSSKGVVTMSM